MTKPFAIEQFNEIYSKVPRACVDLVILNNEGAVLLTKRAIPPAKDMWHIPGGTILYGETFEEAVKRVGKRELGVEVEIIRQIETIEFHNPATDAGGHAVTVEFFVKIVEGVITLDNEASQYQYFQQIPDNTILEQKNFLKRFFMG